MNSEDKQRHDAVYASAIEVYEERDAVRQGLWEKYPPAKQLEQARIKIERCLNALALGSRRRERFQDVLEEIPDIINYTIFAARQCEDSILLQVTEVAEEEPA